MDRSFDTYGWLPDGMRKYLSNYGFNFNRKMFEFACSLMKGRDGKPVKVIGKDESDAMLARNQIKLDRDNGYNSLYVVNMAMADYYGSSIQSERNLSLFVKDYIDDPDGTGEEAFRHFIADCSGKGIVISWDDLL